MTNPYPPPAHAQLVLEAHNAVNRVANDPQADAATRKQSLAAIGGYGGAVKGECRRGI